MTGLLLIFTLILSLVRGASIALKSTPSNGINHRPIAISHRLSNNRRMKAPIRAMIGPPSDDQSPKGLPSKKKFPTKRWEERTCFPVHSSKQEICRKFRGLLERMERIIQLPEEYTIFPTILDCFPVDSTGDLIGALNWILNHAPILHQWSIQQFCMRSAEAGEFSLLNIVMQSESKPSTEHQTSIMRHAIDRQQWITVAELRRLGARFDWNYHFCVLITGAGDKELQPGSRLPNSAKNDDAFEMMRRGLVSVSEAYMCLAQIEDAEIKAEFSKELELMKLRKLQAQNVPQELAIYMRYINHADHIDPLLFAAKEGDRELMQHLLRLPTTEEELMTDRDITHLGPESARDHISIAMTVEHRGVSLFNWHNAALWAIARQHNDVLKMLLTWPAVRRKDLDGLMNEAIYWTAGTAARLLVKLGADPNQPGALNLMRNALRSQTAREISDLMTTGFALPIRAYFYAAQNPNPINAVAITEFLISKRIDVRQNAGVEAVKLLAERTDQRYLFVTIQLLNQLTLSKFELVEICLPAIKKKNWLFLRKFLPLFEERGLELDNLLGILARNNDSDGIAFLLENRAEPVDNQQIFKLLKSKGDKQKSLLEGLRRWMNGMHQRADITKRLNNIYGEDESLLD
jgi:hypothetical protein